MSDNTTDLPHRDTDNVETAVLRARLGSVNKIRLKSLPFFKFNKRKNTKDPLEQGKVYLSISLDQLTAIRKSAADLPEETEEDIERITDRYHTLWGNGLEAQAAQRRRQTISRKYLHHQYPQRLANFSTLRTSYLLWPGGHQIQSYGTWLEG